VSSSPCPLDRLDHEIRAVAGLLRKVKSCHIATGCVLTLINPQSLHTHTLTPPSPLLFSPPPAPPPPQTYYFDKKTHPPVGPEDDEHEVSCCTCCSHMRIPSFWVSLGWHRTSAAGKGPAHARTELGLSSWQKEHHQLRQHQCVYSVAHSSKCRTCTL